MSIQYPDATADAASALPEPYNISSSNNQFSIVVDGGSTQTVTLTNGSARTAAQVVADLSGLTGCTASVVTINSINYFRLRTSSANGMTSSILFNAPSNNSNTVLGFTATTYYGGASTSSTFLADTAQHIINGIETALNNSGWITISGHQSTPCIMQCSMSPPSQNLRMRIQMVAGTNCQINIQNVSGSLAGSNGSGNTGGQLATNAGMAYQVLANKHQAWIFIPGVAFNTNTFCAFGVLSLPSFLQGTVYEAMWLNSNTQNGTTNCFRTCLHTWIQSSGVQTSIQYIFNGNKTDISGNTGRQSGQGTPTLYPPAHAGWGNFNIIGYRWYDGTVVMGDPLMGWGTASWDDENTVKGQLWDAFITTEAFPVDTYLTGIDSHNWHSINHNSTGSTNQNLQGGVRGTLFIVSP